MSRFCNVSCCHGPRRSRDLNMDMNRIPSGLCCHESLKNGEKRRDHDVEVKRNYGCQSECTLRRGDCHSLQTFPSAGQNPEGSSAYLIWPPSVRHNGSAEERADYFSGLQKAAQLGLDRRLPGRQQATTLLDLMTIRAFHTKALRRYSLGTALGFRTRGGVLTNIPAILVFVGRKVHEDWLLDVRKLPSVLEGPGGVWCDVDVVEFSYYGAPAVTPKEQLYTDLVEGLRGIDSSIGAGSQVASQETYGTLGAVVQSRTPGLELGFLTNRHVAVDLDYPNQKMFHPLPPSLGPGVYLGAVERATSFITDDLWYGVFAGMNPETFVRADGAFVLFADTFDLTKVTANLKGVGEMGEVMRADLQAPIDSVIGKHVIKVGRSSGLTKGVIMGYAVEYNDERGICYFTDFLVVGENGQQFDLEGDSGSLILLSGEEYEKPRPIGIIWGGTANRGRLKLRSGHGPENWTSGVDLGRLLDLLQLELITSNSHLLAAMEERRRYQLRLERMNGCIPVERFSANLRVPKEKTPKDVELSKGEEQFKLERNEGGQVGESEDFLQNIAGDGDLSTSRFNQQEWTIRGPVCTTREFSDDEECNLSLGGITGEGLLSSSKQEVKGKIDEDVQLDLGLGDREPKRRRFP